MSQSDVKAILGLPDAVESGFPDTGDLIIKEMPEQRGQMNNSTWFYHRKAYSLPRMTENKFLYFINDKQVSKDIYEDYHSIDSVYLRDNEIVAYNMAVNSKIMNDKRLHTMPVDTARTFMKMIKGRKVYDFFKPIICVIFDRGTNVVAGIKLFELVVKSGGVE